MWLNYEEDVPAVNKPFLICPHIFETQFQEVWESWLKLYERTKPITTLFYEIICNRSKGVNSFLNLSQAIEIYSNATESRHNKAKELAEKEGQKIRSERIPLKYIYHDILSEYNRALELTESNINEYANGFSKMRNYYTHYNTGKYVEPTYDELFSAIHL